MRRLPTQYLKAILIGFPLIFVACVPKTAKDFKTEESLHAYSLELAKKNSVESLKFLREFKNRYPLSPKTPEVELLIGDILYNRGDYEQAVTTYQQFVRLRATHTKAPYATFRTGEAYRKQAPRTIDRDLTYVRLAMEQFGRVKDHPEYGEKAAELGEQMRRRLAEREVYVADYYMKRKNYLAAEARLERLITDYPYDDIRKPALRNLIMVKRKLERNEAAIDSIESKIEALGYNDN